MTKVDVHHRTVSRRRPRQVGVGRPGRSFTTILLLAVALLSGCASAITAPGQQTETQRGSGGPVVTGRGWSGKSILGPIPAPGSCHLRYAGREPLPDPKCTPGAVDSAVSQANLGTTVCRKGGYTSSVRPPESVTYPIKRRLLVAYGIPVADIGRYELDHLLELSSGGSSDVRNLWPEDRQGLFNAGDKDRLEVYLRNQVCSGRMSLRAAQQAVASDWVKAYCDAKLGECPQGLR